MTAATLAERLCAFAINVREHGAPDVVRQSAAQRVLDIVGIGIAATRQETAEAVIGHVASDGGAPTATAIGLGAVPATNAALVNGTLAHSLDYDDTHLPSVLHPSASVVPAAFAAAELADADDTMLLDAVAAGDELCVRVGMAGFDPHTGSSTFFERGQHATSICGTVGGAVAAGLLLGLDHDRLVSALGIAASMGSGILEGNRMGGTVKRIHCGWAAHAGLTAAALAGRGVTAPPTSLEGRFGLFEAFLSGSSINVDAVTSALGRTWEVPGIFFKPYPANHFTHTIIDAARTLRTHGLKPEDVEAVHVGVAAPVVRTIGEPVEIKRQPETGYQAQFSGPYAFAAGLLGGGGLGVGLGDFSDTLARDPRRRALMAKVTVEADDRCTKIFPYQFPAVVTVTTTTGEEVVAEVWNNRGGPGNPLTDDELATKFCDNAVTVLERANADRLADAILTMGRRPGANERHAIVAELRTVPPVPIDPVHHS